VCPPAWVEAIVDHWAKLDELELSFRVGQRSDFEDYKTLALPEVTNTDSGEVGKEKLAGKELLAAAEVMGAELWDDCFSFTQQRGPVMTWLLTGVNLKGRKAERVELFNIPRQCNTDGSYGMGLEDLTGPMAGVDAMLRNSTQQTRDLHGLTVRLITSVADPIEKVGGMYSALVEKHEILQEMEQRLLSEVYRGELMKVRKDISKFRWERIEGMFNATVSTVGADILNLGSMLIEQRFGVSELGPLPRNIMDASRELKHTLTIVQFDGLDRDFGLDFVSLLKSCAEQSDEAVCVASWQAFEVDARKHLEPWLPMLTKRQRSLLHIIRGRINAYTMASEAEQKARSWL